MNLNNYVAVITGGTSGIGEATVRLFIERGAKVVIVGRSEERGKALEEELGHIIYTSPLTQYNGALGAALFAYQKYLKEQKG